jgi:hypothetical protein
MDEQVRYEVRVLGQFGPAACQAIGEMSVEIKPPATVLSGALDQAHLYDLIERIQALGLELVDVHRHPHHRPGHRHNRRPSRRGS